MIQPAASQNDTPVMPAIAYTTAILRKGEAPIGVACQIVSIEGTVKNRAGNPWTKARIFPLGFNSREEIVVDAASLYMDEDCLFPMAVARDVYMSPEDYCGKITFYTDRHGTPHEEALESEPHFASRLPSDPDTIANEDPRRQMWDEITFVARLGDEHGIWWEVEHEPSSESMEDEAALARELVDKAAALQKIFPEARFFVTRGPHIIEERSALCAFVPLTANLSWLDLENLGLGMLGIEAPDSALRNVTLCEHAIKVYGLEGYGDEPLVIDFESEEDRAAGLLAKLDELQSAATGRHHNLFFTCSVRRPDGTLRGSIGSDFAGEVTENGEIRISESQRAPAARMRG